MAKKILFLFIIILLLIGGGVFYWWQNQEDVKELNKGLPEGVRVVKNLKGEYWVVNRIDGYEFKVPDEWGGLREIEYIPEREEKGFRGSSINIIGIKGEARGGGIDRFKAEKEANLIAWAQDMFNTVGLIGDFTPERVGNFEAIKTQENVHLLGMYMYFIKKEASVYTFTCGSEEYIREIIISGKW